MTRTMPTGLAVLALLLSGCDATDRVVFVTDTTVGIGADSTPAQATIGYDRVEGYIAPTYDKGAMPPIVGFVHTGGSIFNPFIRQLYATGEASYCASSAAENCEAVTDLAYSKGGKKLAFFGTVTSVAVRASYASTATTTVFPDSFTIGYKRKEFSYLPLSSEPDPSGTDKMRDYYPAALASIDSAVDTHSWTNIGMENKQFIATGGAAVSLAGALRPRFQQEVSGPVDQAQINAKICDIVLKIGTGSPTCATADLSVSGTLDSGQPAKLTTAAMASTPGFYPVNIINATSLAEVTKGLKDDWVTTLLLWQAAMKS